VGRGAWEASLVVVGVAVVRAVVSEEEVVVGEAVVDVDVVEEEVLKVCGESCVVVVVDLSVVVEVVVGLVLEEDGDATELVLEPEVILVEGCTAGAEDAPLFVMLVACDTCEKLRLVGVSENTVLLASTASTAKRMLQLCIAEMGACGEALFTKYCEREQERRQTCGKELWTV